MIDDKLTLPLIPEAPAADPASVTLFAAGDDGEPPARLYARAGDGTVHALTPPPAEPVNVPACRMVTPGFHGPTIPRTLVNGEPVACYLGPAHRDLPVGTVIEVQWRQVMPRAVDWGEVAICAGGPFIGNPLLSVVGFGDATAMLSTGISTVPASVITVAPIPRGTPLWLVFAVWHHQANAPMPQVMGSAYPDPIASGGVARTTIEGWKPSIVGGGGIGWDAQAGTLPVAAIALVP